MSYVFDLRKFGAVLAGGALVALLGFIQVSVADDWVAVKLRGNVLAFNGTTWDKLERGSVISDNRPIRTTRSGRAEFTRDQESITLGADTEISILDRVGQRYTVVNQKIGIIEVDVEKRNVQHFAVRTPFLAAVVKGTKFTVSVKNGRSQIDVSRGVVSAQDQRRSLKTNVTPGQSANAGRTASLHVSGEGEIAQITDLEGNAVSVSVASNGNGNSSSNSSNGNGNSSSNSSNGNGNSSSNSSNGNGNSSSNSSNGNGNSSSNSSNGNGNSSSNSSNGNGNSSSNSSNGNGNSSSNSSNNNGNGNSGNNGNGNGNSGNNGNGNGNSGDDDDD